MRVKGLVIAIDGFSSCGKSTFAKAIARRLKFAYVDTGAMYRMVTLFAIENGYFDGEDLDSESLVRNLDRINIHFQINDRGENEAYLNGKCVEREIRDTAVTSKVSIVSAVPLVRQSMANLQRKMGETGNIVMDGRDIGTSVFPDASIKLFMTARPEVRARRRYQELLMKGMDADFERILENLKQRDHADSTREISPLRQAEDAEVLDNSEMTPEAQMEWFENRFGGIISQRFV